MNRFFTVSALVVLAASLTACESPLSLGELRALADAEARWAGRGFQDYTFEIRRSCFCEPLITQWARVEVVGGQMTRVVLLDTGAEVPPAQRGRFVTVEQVFTASARQIRMNYWTMSSSSTISSWDSRRASGLLQGPTFSTAAIRINARPATRRVRPIRRPINPPIQATISVPSTTLPVGYAASTPSAFGKVRTWLSSIPTSLRSSRTLKR